MSNPLAQECQFARIALEVAVDQLFCYGIKPALRGVVEPGCWVHIPFGRCVKTGCVISLSETSEVPEVKDILALDQTRSRVSPKLLNLALWISEYYFCPMGLVLKAMVPATIRKKKAKQKYQWRIVYQALPMSQEILTQKQQQFIQFLLQRGGSVLQTQVIRDNIVKPALIKKMSQMGIINLVSEPIYRDPASERAMPLRKKIVPTEEQQAAIAHIEGKLSEGFFSVSLLFGITGSGKTEVYLSAIQKALDLGKEAIFLVPEIALTPQTVERVKACFGDRVVLVHSRLSHGERFDAWSKIERGEASVVVGPRSAVFAPFNNLGVIVIDEEHERTYKQEDAPRYHARDVAIMRAKLEHATVVLGTATPSLESFLNTQKGKYDLLTLNKRVENRALPKVRIIDMRKEVDRHARFVHFSHVLETQLKNCVSKNEQAIIFLNRRGYSPVVMCPKCGKSLSCEHCDMALTYHRSQNLLMCHLCAVTKPMISQCPHCQHTQFKQLGVGTQKIEALLRKIMPQIKIERMDTDSTTHKDAHYKILKTFHDGQTQVLVGTQMIAKGLDFPNVTLVGVISADIAMSLPDFRMGEYIFQLLTQVAGRSGRGEKGGEVFVQTFTPFHPVIRAAALHDYRAFYEAEIMCRKQLNYPPFHYFVVILFEGRLLSAVKEQSQIFATLLARNIASNQARIVGPLPAPLERIKENYRWQIIASAKTRLGLHGFIRKTWQEIVKKSSVKITVDVDPMSMT